MVELRRAAVRTAAAALVAAQKLHDAGNISDLDLANGRAEDVRARIDLNDAETAAAEAREKVNEQMGLGEESSGWTMASGLADIPAAEVSDQDLETLALQQRQDLAAARQKVGVEARVLGLTTDFRFFDGMTAGPEFERETDHQWRIGPTVSVPVPLFDQGQEKVGRAQAVLRQSEERYYALTLDVRREVRAGGARLSHARVKALLYRDEVLPTEQELGEQMQRRYNGMYAGVFELLRSRRREIDASGEYIEALRDYWTARAELERAVGGRLPAARAAPTTQGE
jgi:cobalt-zinc-cadmium efflux system outer membrane protein